jgi:tetratricopeptide (TPR) repeat protein
MMKRKGWAVMLAVFFPLFTYAQEDASKPTLERVEALQRTMQADSLGIAISLLDRMTSDDTSNFELYIRKVRLKWWLAKRNGDVQALSQVIRTLDTAIYRAPQNMSVGSYLQGCMLDFLGKSERARLKYTTSLALLDEAIANNPEDYEQLSARAMLLSLLGRKDEAVQAVKDLLKHQPDNEAYQSLLRDTVEFDRAAFLASFQP